MKYLLSALALSCSICAAQDRGYERFQPEIKAFTELDAQQKKTGGVVFVGSSSIRLWKTLNDQFKDVRIVQRGFGGSRLADCAYYAKDLVVPHNPRLVLIYAGDNDLNEGATPEQVYNSFKQFVQSVRAELPFTRIGFISIKPSPARAKIIPAIQLTNSLIRTYVQEDPNLDYIDIFTPMMDERNEPRSELFSSDLLHLNDEGYQVWQRIINAYLY